MNINGWCLSMRKIYLQLNKYRKIYDLDNLKMFLITGNHSGEKKYLLKNYYY